MECRLIQQADRIIASTNDERLQMIRHCGATPARYKSSLAVSISNDFVPNDQQQAREKLGLKRHATGVVICGQA